MTTETWIIVAVSAFVLLVFAMIVLIFRVLGVMKTLKHNVEAIGGRVEELAQTALGVMEDVDQEMDALNGRLDGLEVQINGVLKELDETLKLTKALEEAVIQRIKSLDPILDSTAQIAKDVEFTVHDVRQKVEQVSDFFNAAEDAAKTMRSVTGVVRGGLLGAAIEIASLASGAKASIEFLTRRFEKQKRREKGGR